MSDLAPFFRQQFFNQNGVPLASGQIFTYAAGTTTPLATYTDQSGLTPNANPIILDSTGQAPIWLGPSAYKFVIEDSLSNVIETVDQVQSITYQINQLISANGTSVWQSVNVSYTQLQTAGLTNAIALFTLPANTILKNLVIILGTQFAGTSISTLSAQVGLSGAYQTFIDDFSLLQSVSGTSFDNVQTPFIGSTSGSTVVYLNAVAVGANLSALSTGALMVKYETATI